MLLTVGNWRLERLASNDMVIRTDTLPPQAVLSYSFDHTVYFSGTQQPQAPASWGLGQDDTLNTTSFGDWTIGVNTGRLFIQSAGSLQPDFVLDVQGNYYTRFSQHPVPVNFRITEAAVCHAEQVVEPFLNISSTDWLLGVKDDVLVVSQPESLVPAMVVTADEIYAAGIVESRSSFS